MPSEPSRHNVFHRFSIRCMAAFAFLALQGCSLPLLNALDPVQPPVELNQHIAQTAIERFGPVIDKRDMAVYLNLLARAVASKDATSRTAPVVVPLEASEPLIFSSPDGHIYLTAGMMRVAQNEAEMAAALAREYRLIERGRLETLVDRRTGTSSTLTRGRVRSVNRSVAISRRARSLARASAAEEILFYQGYPPEALKDAEAFAARSLNEIGYNPWGLKRFYSRLAEQRRNAGGILEAERLRDRIAVIDEMLNREFASAMLHPWNTDRYYDRVLKKLPKESSP